MGALFGQYIRKKRMATGKTLREFCVEHDLDAAKISKIERCILPLPEEGDKLTHYARCLGITEGSDDWLEFFETAKTDAGRVADGVPANSESAAHLPLIFRTLKGQKLPGEQLDRLAHELEKLNDCT